MVENEFMIIDPTNLTDTCRISGTPRGGEQAYKNLTQTKVKFTHGTAAPNSDTAAPTGEISSQFKIY